MMQIPLEITCRGVENTEAIEGLIGSKGGKHERICNYITSTRIAVESSQEHQGSGSPCEACISPEGETEVDTS